MAENNSTKPSSASMQQIAARLKMAAGWVSDAELVAKQTKDREAAKLIKFLNDNTALAIPIQGYYFTQYDRGLKRSHIKASLMPITKTDMKRPDSMVFDWDKSDKLASYLHKPKVMVVRQDIKMSPTWRGLVLLHEARHALDLTEDPYDVSDPTEFSRHERDVFAMEIRLVGKLGGRAYEQLMKTHKLPEVSQALHAKGRSVQVPSSGRYETKLDDIFGAAASTGERRTRQTVYWLDAVFRTMDTQFADPELDKLYFIRNLYGKQPKH